MSNDVLDIGGFLDLQVQVNSLEFVVVHVHETIGSNGKGLETLFMEFVVVVDENNVLFVVSESEVFDIVTIGLSVGLFPVIPRVIQS